MNMLKITKEELVCPISRQIFRNPVVAADGFTYEELEILKWFKVNKTSPRTRQYMSEKLTDNRMVQNLVEDFLSKNPQEKVNQYSSLYDHQLYYEKINVIISNNEYRKLLEYGNFSMELFFEHCNIKILLKRLSYDLLKHIIDNCIDLEYKDHHKKRLIHYLVKFVKNFDIIKYFIENKKININCSDKKANKPINLAILYNSPMVTKYLISKEVSLLHQNGKGQTILHMLAFGSQKKYNIDLLRYIIKINPSINLEQKTSLGNPLIHLLLDHCSDNIDNIKFLVDHGIDLESHCWHGQLPIHIAIKKSKPKIAKFLIELNVDLETPTRKNNYTIHLATKYNLEDVICLLIKRNVNLNVINNKGRKPIHQLAKKASYQTIKKMLKKNIDFNNVIKKNKKKSIIDLVRQNPNLTIEQMRKLELIIQLITCL